MELTPEQKARIVENRRLLLRDLEQLASRQSAAVATMQESLPLQVRAHADTCTHNAYCWRHERRLVSDSCVCVPQSTRSCCHKLFISALCPAWCGTSYGHPF